MSNPINEIFKNGLLLIVSTIFSLVLAELALRLVYDPIDYLLVDLAKDPILNHKIEPNESGHDSWGFRNSDVPNQADIVAIGDSMTYGIMAKSTNSWPAHLEKISGSSVYNLSLGGYGPLHYLHLLENYAVDLTPKSVVVGLYMGNDLMDSYNLAYSKQYWSQYRSEENSPDIANSLVLSTVKNDEKLFYGLRNFLATNSILYRIVSQNTLFNQVRVQETVSNVSIEHHGQEFVFNTNKAFRNVNFADKRIPSALEITKSAISKISDYCKQRNIDFTVVLIPIKENVFRDQLISNCDRECDPILANKFASLDKIRTILLDHFLSKDISTLDLLTPLRKASAETIIFPQHDGHLNSNGYEVIAKEIYKVRSESQN